ncbi:MAG TPA: hypothetical protein VM219_08115 [Phycisphaerae bacterium]|nr:hypothetical protein [Phycisphaerae bacterium]
MSKGEYKDHCLYCWGDPRTQDTLISGRIFVCKDEVRFESDDLVLSWPFARIRGVSYEPTHPVDIDAVAGGSVDVAGDIAIALAMDHIPDPAISMLVEDPEGIVVEGFDIRLVFDTEYRAKLAMKRIESALDPRYSGSESAHVSTQAEEPASGWSRVDRTLRDLRARLRKARTEDQCQAVGLLCREILISLAQAVYDPEVHRPIDGVQPSSTDAARMLEAYIATELKGKSNEAVRRHTRAALSLANDLQHQRTATTRGAALCAEATASLVNLIAILTGWHGGA